MTSFKFFRIILTQDSMNKLDLPKKFVRLYGEALPTRVLLKLPCGQQWKIGLLKTQGKVYLQQGWPEFAKHYGLDRGNLLFFRYKGNSHFSISIYDKTTCEIDYASHSVLYDENRKVASEEETEEDDSVLPPRSPSHKRMRTNAFGRCKNAELQSFTSEDESDYSDSETKDKFGKFKSQYQTLSSPSRRGPYISYRDSKAFEEASKFTSSNPFFRKVMRPHASASFNMRVPDYFVRCYLAEKTQFVMLQVGAKYWPVKLLKCKSGFFFSKGWSRFISENSLLPGDVCVYELMKKRNQAVVKVSIFKS